MATLDFNRFRLEIESATNSRAVSKAAFDEADKRVKAAKQEMINDFNAHEVTQEIEAGGADPLGAQNTTNTLGGQGNLYSFIGFAEGDNPTEAVRGYLEDKTRLRTHYTFNQRLSRFLFKVDMPAMDEVEKRTPSPWEPKSWTRGIERGISGLGFYLHSRLKGFAGSRSSAAIQSEQQIRSAGYKPIKYLSEIIKNFRNKL